MRQTVWKIWESYAGIPFEAKMKGSFTSSLFEIGFKSFVYQLLQLFFWLSASEAMAMVMSARPDKRTPWKKLRAVPAQVLKSRWHKTSVEAGPVQLHRFLLIWIKKLWWNSSLTKLRLRGSYRLETYRFGLVGFCGSPATSGLQIRV